MTADVAIVGGGVVGAACAFEFSRAGFSVTVIEPGEIGGGATAAAMGHVVVMDDSEAQFALTRLSRDLWQEYSAELSPTGTLWIAADSEELAEVQRKYQFFTSRGVRAELLDAQQLQEAEPNLRQGLAGALLVPDDRVVDPSAVARDLIARSSVKIVRACAVAIVPGRVMLHTREVVESDVIINAAGIHAPALMPSLRIAITPRKGHLILTESYPGFAHHQLVELGYLKSAHEITTESSVAFNVQPRKTGQLLVGSSRQFGADYPEIDAPVLHDMVRRATEYMPGIAQLATVRAWTGFRGATRDKLPLIGPCPGIPNAFVAAGHEGLGVTTSFATARLLADFIMKRTPPIPIEPYFPDRKI